MMADVKWKDVTFNIPSLLPLQAVPQEPDPGRMLVYLQSLHNYLAGDRLSIARAINVLSYYRNIFGITDDQPDAGDTKAFFIREDTAEAFIDTSEKSGTATWEPIVAGSVGSDAAMREFGIADSMPNKYLTYVAGVLDLIELHDTGMTKRYEKQFNYTGSVLDDIVLTRMSDSATWTKTFTYVGGVLEEIEAA
jgi:hypothetical protein